jgi:hypothetical protein
VEFQTRVLRLRGWTDLPPFEVRLRVLTAPERSLLLPTPEFRLLPTVVGELLPLRLLPLEAPPTRVVPRQLSEPWLPRSAGASPERTPSPAAVWRLRVADVPVRPGVFPSRDPVSRMRKPP